MLERVLSGEELVLGVGCHLRVIAAAAHGGLGAATGRVCGFMLIAIDHPHSIVVLCRARGKKPCQVAESAAAHGSIPSI